MLDAPTLTNGSGGEATMIVVIVGSPTPWAQPQRLQWVARTFLPAKEGLSMRKLLLASAATLAIATPAAARDGSGYIGIEGGILFPQSQSGVFTGTFTQ